VTKTNFEHTVKAGVLWDAMSRNERHGVRFGMFPAAPMAAAEAEGYDAQRIAVALMDVAEHNGGMCA
jgi:hypothetical protein